MSRLTDGRLALPLPQNPPRRPMVFIDGAYLRNGCIRLLGTDSINWGILSLSLEHEVLRGICLSLPIRFFYYDAQYDRADNPELYQKQDQYLEQIQKNAFFTVRLGRIRKGKDESRQKGVDILLAVDMLGKAFLNHYDVACLIAGDDDFVDLVGAIRQVTDKLVYGVFFSHNISRALRACFDFWYEIDKTNCEEFAFKVRTP